MPLHTNTILFPITTLIAGCRFFGSDENDRSCQFSLEGLLTAVASNTDVLHYSNATKVGQTVVANQDPLAIDLPGVNGGRKFVGVINTFPATLESHFDMIYLTL